MWQRFINWLKSLFGSTSEVHHEDNGLWWQDDRGTVKVGLDSNIIDELGAVTYLQTAQPNDSVKPDDQLIDIEADKAVATFKSPVAGTVSQVNTDYQDHPEKLTGTKDPLLLKINKA